MQNEEWNVSAVSLSPELVRLAQQKQARFEACLQAAENGNEAAITELGINYFYGTNGAPEDPDAAFYWLSRTSPENAAGRCFLGACYVIGKGTKQDERTAAELFRDSAALGFPPAQYELGLCYEHGIGLERNMARAVELYALAAEQEDAQAQCALGNLYFTGNGVEQDRALSMVLSWYEQKAVCILLTLLHLGIRNIRLGPTLPAFLSPNVLQYLVEHYAIAPITTPEADLAALLGS